MPKHTITLSQEMQARLARLVAQHNAAHGTEFTVGQWLTMHVKELAIAPELAAQRETLRRQAEGDLEAALAEIKQRLLSDGAAGEEK